MDVAKSGRKARRAAALALLAEYPAESDRFVARLAGMSPTTIGRLRAESGHGQAETGQTDRQPDVGGNEQSKLDSPKQTGQTDTRLGGNVSAELPSPCESDVADGPACVPCCPCGGEWASDGEGGRYCQDCGAVHPASPSVPHPLAGDDLAETRRAASEFVAVLWDIRQRAERLPVVRDEIYRQFERHVGAALAAAGRWT